MENTVMAENINQKVADKCMSWSKKKILCAVVIGLLIICIVILAVMLIIRDCKADSKSSHRTSPLNETLRNDEIANRTDGETRDQIKYRLPRNVLPLNYKLTLQPDISNKVTYGNVSILINVVKNTQQIVMHSKEIFIEEVVVTNKLSNDLAVTKIHTDDENTNFLTIQLKHELNPGPHTIKIRFIAKLEYGLDGFYAIQLKNGGTVITNIFEPTDARKSFPCFDEPGLKATFEVTLVSNASVVLSNMNEISREYRNGIQAVSFATSAPMSTYLVCFLICDYDFKEAEVNYSNETGKFLKIRAFAQKDQINKTNFVLDITKKAIEYYTNQHGVPYTLPKLDMAGIPEYIAGGTEHWGMISYKESRYLMDENNTDIFDMVSVGMTAVHEIAHQWFGNLVTMKWWNDLWLSESFATFFECKALNAIMPDWDVYDYNAHLIDNMIIVDAQLTSHPIIKDVKTPEQISGIFGPIAYSKGGALLRMIEGFIGEENFQEGLSNYLNKYQFGLADTQDFISILEQYFPFNLTHVIETWTTQTGYPVLTVTESDQPNKFVITQSRFLIDSTVNRNNTSEYSNRWYIPITYKTDQTAYDDELWFSDTVQNVHITLNPDEIWLKLNNNRLGLYIVNYSLDMWNKLIQQLKYKTPMFTTLDRAQLLFDAFLLADAEMVPIELALNASTYLYVEEGFAPWKIATISFKNIARKLHKHPLAFQYLRDYVQSLVDPLYWIQTWKKSDISVKSRLLRASILQLAVFAELPDAQSEAQKLFSKWMDNQVTGRIEPDLRDIVLNQGMKTASMPEWEKVWRIYLNTNDVHEKIQLLKALAGPRDPKILKRYLKLAWNTNYVKKLDYLWVVNYICKNPLGTKLVWDEIRDRWPEIVERFSIPEIRNRIISHPLSYLSTSEELRELKVWMKQYPNVVTNADLAMIKQKIRWDKTHKPGIVAWLKARISRSSIKP